jgi:MEMO1 family protein
LTRQTPNFLPQFRKEPATIRKPAVAGRFYPARPAELTSALEAFVQPVNDPATAIGIIVPHAGYMYSGHVAGAVYSEVKLPQRNIVLCPNHTGRGVPLSIMRSGQWETPLGNMQIDEELCAALMESDPALENDTAAHQFEHALEVQLPFMHHVAGPDVTFVPITVGTNSWSDLSELGHAMAAVVQKVAPEALIIASSDMNHYESDAITRIKDRKAIDQILELDALGLYEVVDREDISMCGYGPATAMLTAARILHASKANLVKYATSADVSGDFDRVVGYAGMVIA